MAMNKREKLIDGLVSAGTVNILCGASGAGKTTWIFHSMHDWLKGLPVLGHASIQDASRRKFFYIAADRDEDDVAEMLDRLGMTGMPHAALLEGAATVTDFLRLVPEDTSIMVIDGVSMLVEGGRISDNDTVGKFLRRCRIWAKAHKCALWFLCHSPKKWKGEEIINVRENILGSIAWGAFADTVIYAQKDDPKDPDNTSRTFYVEPRHGKMEQHQYKFDEQGRFVEVMTPREQVAKITLLAKMTIGTIYTRKELVELGIKNGMAPATVDRSLKALVAAGDVVKVDDGEYAAVGQKLLTA